MKESKEKIRARMIKNASRIWGFSDTEAESSFDPLVSMIMGALSNELDTISDDINNTESRIVEKLIQLVTPEPITGPFPAHAILRADPVLPVFDITPAYQFYLYKKFKSLSDSTKTEEKSIFFSPAGTYKLIKGGVRFIASGNRIHEFLPEGYKEIRAEAVRGSSLPNTSFWLGIDLDEEVESLDGLRLFFELRSDHHSRSLYQSLARGSWYINDIPVTPSQGYGNEPDRFRRDLESVINQEIDITAKVTRHVNEFYGDQFITLETGPVDPEKFISPDQYPKIIRETFRTEDLEPGPRNFFWLEIRHGQPYAGDIIDELHCSMNCFPVVNRQLNEFTISSRDNINIIPLETEDSFLDIKSVTNSSGKTYSMKSFTSLGEIQKGSYILRQGGIARFDSRNAREMINYLLELLRDESAAFSILGTDMISSNLRELNQGIARLEQRLQDSNIVRENLSYLMLKAEPQDDMVFVEFWSTKASQANKIKSGNKLAVYEGSDIKNGSVVLMTSTVGGRDKMETEDRLNAYRRTLLSRGRVVTPEDVKVLCYEHFGKNVDKVEIRKGLTTGDSVTEGFIRSVDVFITLSKRMTPYPEDELRFMIDDLHIRLREQSSNNIPFRIFIK
jgi:hypothetical protein